MSEPVVGWTDMVGKCEGLGLLAKKNLYDVFTTPTNGIGPVMKNLEDHLEFQRELQDNGIMFGAGPFSDDDESNWNGEGMVIIRAASLGEAKKIAEGDPMHTSGARSFRVRPWLLNEGKVTIELTYSDKGMSVV